MRLLERHVNTEMDSDSRGGGYPRRGGGVELDGSANVFIIRFSLKALVNLNSTVGVSAAQYQEKLGRVLHGTPLSADLLLLASQDELIGFYMKLLSTE